VQVISIHVGAKQSLDLGRRTVTTGIFKQTAPGRVTVTTMGLEGDVICDRRHHGGKDQAVYVYTDEDYAFWKRQYRQAFAPGSFGENLRVSGLDAASLSVGDALIFPDLTLEVTGPRIPCAVLGAAIDQKQFALAFQKAARPGFYCRVLTPGTVGAGDGYRLEASGPERASLLVVYRANYDPPDQNTLTRLLALPIDRRTRNRFKAKLASLA